MTARRLALESLPDWPRFMKLTQAAAWAGVSPDVFMMEVKAGIWPKPVMRGAKASLATWDRVLLDKAADEAAGLISSQTPAAVAPQAIEQDIRSRIRAKAAQRSAQTGRQTP